MQGCNLAQTVRDIAVPVPVLLQEKDTIDIAIKKIREAKVDTKIIYFYVVDDQERLLGTVSTRKLLLSDSLSTIGSIMQKDVQTILAHQTLKEAIETFKERGLLALPVVDVESRLLGTIDIDMYLEESIDIANAKHRFDVFQMIGISLQDEKRASLLKNFRLRMPWILCNMAGGLFCAFISRIYSDLLSQIILVAMFIPLVLSLSESIAMQSMAHSLHIIQRRSSSKKYARSLVTKEIKILLFMAVFCGLFIGGISLLWQGGTLISLIIGLSILLSILIASAFALVFPFFIHKTKLDPKVASGPVILTISDVMTTTLYLSLASWFLL